VDVAGRLLRKRGFGDIRIADLTKSAGLAHGPFYNPFDSEIALAGEACEQVLRRATEAWTDIVNAVKTCFSENINAHLSRAHRDDTGNGCLIAAHGADVVRQVPLVQRSFTAAMRPMGDFMM
jgi:TetR/AcrR family transcriptional repressor of nem operon